MSTDSTSNIAGDATVYLLACDVRVMRERRVFRFFRCIMVAGRDGIGAAASDLPPNSQELNDD